MLILQRSIDESILIGPDTEIKVIEVKGGRVKLGITAPVDVRVDCAEVAERKDRAK